MPKGFFPVVPGLLLLLALPAHMALERPLHPASAPDGARRIVSLAPGITETLYALKLGPRIAGVTSYCLYPPEAALKPRVAGFSDVNLEAVLRARPDLVLLPEDKRDNLLRLETLGLPALPLDVSSPSALAASVERIGNITGREAEAEALLAEFRGGLEAAAARAAGNTPPRVLFSVMRDIRGGGLSEVIAVGGDGFYSELIALAGGDNVCAGHIAFPRISREALIFLDPEVMIDALPGGDAEQARRDWESLSSVGAVQTGRVLLLTDPADTIPGPRFFRTLDKLSRAFHGYAREAVPRAETFGHTDARKRQPAQGTASRTGPPASSRAKPDHGLTDSPASVTR
ncbi:MAG: helical backbone metal receptor [Desulfovibrio sp.]|jgi:iron complex transport system substrate-binding protein|nr:helical backbone metal receptor [Desulfovibrio sp.]